MLLSSCSALPGLFFAALFHLFSVHTHAQTTALGTWLTRDDVETLGAIADTRHRRGIAPTAPLDHAQITDAFELLRAELAQQAPTFSRDQDRSFGIDLD